MNLGRVWSLFDADWVEFDKDMTKKINYLPPGETVTAAAEAIEVHKQEHTVYDITIIFVSCKLAKN